MALASEILGDPELAEGFTTGVQNLGVGPATFETAFADYLAAEQQAGRVGPDVDTDAYGFLLGAAVHNLVVSGPAYPRPPRRRLAEHLAAIAAQLQP